MGLLGISYDTFYDLSPKEFYYASKARFQMLNIIKYAVYEAARWQTATMINMDPMNKTHIEDVTQLGLFSWEEGFKEIQQGKRVSIKQDQAQITANVLAWATKCRATRRVKEDMNGPPLYLAPQFRK